MFEWHFNFSLKLLFHHLWHSSESRPGSYSSWIIVHYRSFSCNWSSSRGNGHPVLSKLFIFVQEMIRSFSLAPIIDFLTSWTSILKLALKRNVIYRFMAQGEILTVQYRISIMLFTVLNQSLGNTSSFSQFMHGSAFEKINSRTWIANLRIEIDHCLT